ncbi:MAG: flagellar basal body-associated FliL family protein [Bdellovibrionales bacterium]|nr:flagellar basal body-associated FliL family protein [Bdellovibrionales bacterium]
MAEKEKKEDESAEATVAPAKTGKKKLFIIGGAAIVLLLCIGAPVMYFVLAGGEEETDAQTVDPKTAVEKEVVLMMEGFEEEDELEDDEAPLGAFYPFETFVVNLTGGGYLRLQLHAEFIPRDIPKKFYTKLIPIRDRLITLFSNKTRDDLSTEELKGKLKVEIIGAINEMMRKETIRRVYFTQFIVQ